MTCSHEWYKDYAFGCPPFQYLYCSKCREPYPELRESEKKWVIENRKNKNESN